MADTGTPKKVASSDVSSVIDNQKISSNSRSSSFHDKIERKLQIQNLINKCHQYHDDHQRPQNRQNQARRVVSLNYYCHTPVIWSHEKSSNARRFDDDQINDDVAVHHHHHSMQHRVNFCDQNRSSTMRFIDSDSQICNKKNRSFRKEAIVCHKEPNSKADVFREISKRECRIYFENSNVFSCSACSDVTESSQLVRQNDGQSCHDQKNDVNGRISNLSKTCRSFRQSWNKRSRISQAFDDLSKAVVKRFRKMSNLQKERKATKFVAIVLAAFVICWSPFFLFNALIGVCLTATGGGKDRCQFIPAEVMCLAVWLGYANSCLNPILYAMLNRQFRSSYKIILGRLWCRYGNKRI
uniref:G-protein coupled receptors family 1 profile domain-containing protein n=1 Tax=Romanomermis culicivorax TaxID=13658 RepID=A0A915KVV9_ROMCU